MYICPLLLEPPFPFPTPSYPSRLSQSTILSSWCYSVTSHCLSLLHTVMYMFQCYFLTSSHPLLPLLCPQACSLCLCHCSGLQIGSSVPFIYIYIYIYICACVCVYICINIQNLFFFSFWLTSFCIIGSRFTHLTRTDSNLFLFMAE